MSSYPNLANGWTSTLTSGISSGATSADVADATGMPAFPFQAVIAAHFPDGTADGSNSDEIVTVTGLSTLTAAITRHTEANAAGSSTGSAHASGVVISHVLTAGALAAAVGSVSGGSGFENPMTDGGDLIVGWNPTLDNVALGTLGASCTREGVNAPLLIDGNDATSVNIDNYGPVIITLDKAYAVTQIRILQGSAMYEWAASVEVYHSTNGSDWTLVGGLTHTMTSNDDTWAIASVTAQYWKFVPNTKYWTPCTFELRSADPAPGTPFALSVGADGTMLAANSALGSGMEWLVPVYIHAGAPGGTYVAPFWFDSTASTGGLYAWNGSAYSRVGLATS